MLGDLITWLNTGYSNPCILAPVLAAFLLHQLRYLPPTLVASSDSRLQPKTLLTSLALLRTNLHCCGRQHHSPWVSHIESVLTSRGMVISTVATNRSYPRQLSHEAYLEPSSEKSIKGTRIIAHPTFSRLFPTTRAHVTLPISWQISRLQVSIYSPSDLFWRPPPNSTLHHVLTRLHTSIIPSLTNDVAWKSDILARTSVFYTHSTHLHSVRHTVNALPKPDFLTTRSCPAYIRRHDPLQTSHPPR